MLAHEVIVIKFIILALYGHLLVVQFGYNHISPLFMLFKHIRKHLVLSSPKKIMFN